MLVDFEGRSRAHEYPRPLDHPSTSSGCGSRHDNAARRRGSLRRETFGFPQVYAAVHQGSANLRFLAVGIIWNSLDSLVRNGPFQWVTGRPGPNLFSSRPFPARTRQQGRPSSIRRSTALNLLAGRKGLARSWIMAVDIARVRLGIGNRLTSPSLFGKKLSTGRHFIQNREALARCRSP